MAVSTEEQEFRELILRKLNGIDGLGRSVDALRGDFHDFKDDSTRRRDAHEDRLRALETKDAADGEVIKSLKENAEANNDSFRAVVTVVVTNAITGIGTWLMLGKGGS